jgi:hypothetical protein
MFPLKRRRGRQELVIYPYKETHIQLRPGLEHGEEVHQSRI